MHLSGEKPEKEERFLRFLAGRKGRVGAIYVLGDLFDFWIGPGPTSARHAQVLAALKDLSASGVKLAFLHGNRDFHIEADSESHRRKGLSPRAVVATGRKRVYMTHGDFLCTRDSRYHQFTAIIRSPLVKKIFQMLPAGWGYYLANGYRGHSKRVTRQKPGNVRGLVMKSVMAAFGEEYDVLVCGHVHPPRGLTNAKLSLAIEAGRCTFWANGKPAARGLNIPAGVLRFTRFNPHFSRGAQKRQHCVQRCWVTAERGSDPSRSPEAGLLLGV